MTANSMSRRSALQLLLGTGASIAVSERALADTQKKVLIIGLDFTDNITFDPSRFATNSSPMVLRAAYDTLLTMAPGNYVDLLPRLATSWARTPDGKGWRFKLRDRVKFASGNPMTADDVKWSLERVIGLKDQPAQYVGAIERINVVDPLTVDLILTHPDEPILSILSAPEFVVLDRKTLEKNGGMAGPDAKTQDKATPWLNDNSAGTGAYRLAKWERNTAIQLVANPNHWGGRAPFERIIIRAVNDGAAQLLAIRRGDIDAAFNLLPEQITSLKGDKAVRIESTPSLDFVYLGLTNNAEFNKALAIKEVRQAINYAIDYEGIKNSLLGGAATRPAGFLPVGVRGSTEALTREIGYREDLDKAKKLLAAAGYADGFEFKLYYGNAAFNATPYQTIALKLQSDLARVGIRVALNPMDPVTYRTMFTLGKADGGVLAPWIPAAIENSLWAQGCVDRLAKRIHWSPPPELVQLVTDASRTSDPEKATQLWIQFQKAIVDNGHVNIIFQDIYRIAVYKAVGKFPLSGAGWKLDLEAVTKA